MHEELSSPTILLDGAPRPPISELLWECYSASNPVGNDRIDQLEAALQPFHDRLSFEGSNRLFRIIYDLTVAHQHAAFIDGLGTGYQLHGELTKHL